MTTITINVWIAVAVLTGTLGSGIFAGLYLAFAKEDQ